MEQKITLKDLDRACKDNNWCPGCGNFGILTAIKMAVMELGIPRDEFVLTSGIGCSSKIPYWVKTIGFNSIHGRGIPVAEGIKLTNPRLTVVSAGGDGDGYGEGLQHFIHACKRNINISYFVHDNLLYALTKNQTSPTTEQGIITKTSPQGNYEVPFNPISVAIASGASFVARGYAGDIQHLKWLMMEAIKHKGFALIDIFQPCVTFNHHNTFQFWKERVYKLQDQGHDITSKESALKKAEEFGEKVPIGIFYKHERKTYEENCIALQGGKALIDYPINKEDISQDMEKYV